MAILPHAKVYAFDLLVSYQDGTETELTLRLVCEDRDQAEHFLAELVKIAEAPGVQLAGGFVEVEVGDGPEA